ncbi:MAG: leucine-rich repeat protein [Acutalibacteraceae bacterium]
MKKRVVSLLLIVSLIFSMAAVTGMTASAETYDVWEYTILADNTVEVTGYSGEDVDIVIPGTIDGKTVTSIGAYAFYDSPALKSIEIPDSVTSIGSYALFNCTALKSIEIPDSVKSIGMSAFCECTALASAKISSSVTSIEGYEFFNCSALISIEIPDSVKSIGMSAFSKCTSLVSVKIGSGVTSIGSSAFAGCSSLSSITVADGNTKYSSENGVLFDKSKTNLLVYPVCKEDTEFTIPSSVTSLDIEAFSGCAFLTSIAVADGNTKYSSENGVLFDKSKATLLKYPEGKKDESYTIPSSVTDIGKNAFCGCKSLESVTIQNGVESIESHAFTDCTSLESVTIQNGVEFIDSYAFADCTALTTISIPNSVTKLGQGILQYCTSLESVDIGSGLDCISEYTFEYCTALKSVVIPDGITSIGECAFNGCTSLESVTIPDSVVNIKKKAFFDTAIYNNADNWDNSVLYVDNCLVYSERGYLDYDNKYIVTDEVEGDYKIKDGTRLIAERAFVSREKLTSIDIPSSVTTIGEYAFYSCKSLKSVEIPDSVTSIGIDALGFCWDNGYKKMDDFVIACYAGSAAQAHADYYNLKTALISVPDNFTAEELEDGTLEITGYDGIENISILRIPSEIGGKTVSKIGDAAFREFEFITSVSIPNTVTTIGDNAFFKCTSLKSITVPSSVTTIGNYALGFNSDEKLEGFYINCLEGSAAERYASENGIDAYIFVHNDTVAADCENDGMLEHYSCSECDIVFDKNMVETTLQKLVIATTGHTYVLVDEVPATYDNDGVKAHNICSACNKLFDLDKNKVTADELVIPKLEMTVIYGDANGDGKINLLDLIAMRKYLAKWNVEIDLTAADCNADGKVNLLDLILMRKYLAKWDVVLGPQK